VLFSEHSVVTVGGVGGDFSQTDRTGPYRATPYSYRTAVIVLDDVFDVLKYLARMWQHLPWTPGTGASTE